VLALETRRGRALFVGALMLLAFGLRVVFVLGMRDNPTFDRPILDGEYHVDWARAIAAGEDFYALKHGGHPGPYFRAPLYIWFLGAIFRFFGDGLLLPRLVQCSFGAATTLLAYLIGKRAFDVRVGLLAALMAATYWVSIYFDGELLIETLVVPLDMLALWLTMGLAERRTPLRAALAGLAWGVAAIARPNVLVYAPCVVLWLAWLERARWKQALAPAAAFTLAFFVPILPITAINYFHGGDTVLIASQGGVNFWIGNNPQSDGSTAIVPGTRGGWWQGYRDSIALAEHDEQRELRPSEVSRYYARKTWAFLLGQPAQAAELLLHKLRLFWVDYELGNNEDVSFVAHRFSWVARWMPLRFAVLGPLGLLGLVLVVTGKGRVRNYPLWSFLLVYMASVVAFFVCSRFRAPVLPVLMVLASHAALWIVEAFRARSTERLALAAAVLIPAAFLVNVLPPNLRQDDSNGYLQMGVAEGTRGNMDLAIEYLEKSVQINDQNVFAHTLLGKVLHERHRSEEAIVHLQKALMTDTRKVDALEYLLNVYFDLGRFPELERTVQNAVGIHPESDIPYYHYGRMRMEQARRAGGAAAKPYLDEAQKAFEEALSRKPGSFRTLFALANCLAASGDLLAAIPYSEQALQNIGEDEAYEPQAFEFALELYVRAGQPEKACALARAWSSKRPDEPRAKAAVEKYCH
jgi:tetratricopeptide (TPR) repeat protein